MRITKLVDDSWIIADIAMIKDALSSGDITELRHCRSERMLANYLAKNGACGNELMETMKSGVYKLTDDRRRLAVTAVWANVKYNNNTGADDLLNMIIFTDVWCELFVNIIYSYLKVF